MGLGADGRPFSWAITSSKLLCVMCAINRPQTLRGSDGLFSARFRPFLPLPYPSRRFGQKITHITHARTNPVIGMGSLCAMPCAMGACARWITHTIGRCARCVRDLCAMRQAITHTITHTTSPPLTVREQSRTIGERSANDRDRSRPGRH